jgi:hypothetical protein
VEKYVVFPLLADGGAQASLLDVLAELFQNIHVLTPDGVGREWSELNARRIVHAVKNQ